jgi:hypothetical protein
VQKNELLSWDHLIDPNTSILNHFISYNLHSSIMIKDCFLNDSKAFKVYIFTFFDVAFSAVGIVSGYFEAEIHYCSNFSFILNRNC